MRLLAPQFLPLLLVALLGIWWVANGLRARRRARAAFTGEGLRALPASAYLEGALPVLALIALGLALARPAWEKEPSAISRGGRDVLFLLDVSRSMLASDLAPDRLGAAKRAILDCVESFEGNRVGLVTFAGSPSTVCPLTTDYGYFRQMVEEASPENVDHGGTRIGDALRRTVDKLLDPRRAGLQDIVLLSDGGDQESQPEDAAAELDEYGVFLIAIGLGDDATGARVPARLPEGVKGNASAEAGGFTMHEGKEIWSRLEPAALKQMAKAAEGGVYLHAGTRNLELGRVYHDLIRHLQRRNPDMAETMLRWREEFSWFLGAALGLLFLQPIVGLLRNRRGRTEPRIAASAKAVALALCAGAFLTPQARAESGLPDPPPPRDRYNEGVRLYGEEDFAGATEAFRQALNTAGSQGRIALHACYNLGRAHFALAEAEPDLEVLDPEDEEFVPPPDPVAEYHAAARAFRACLDRDPDHPAAAWNLELALLRAREAEDMAQDSDSQEQEQDENEQEEGESPEGDPSESDEEDFGDEWEESDEEGDGTPSDYQSSQSAMDLQNQDIPPPNVDPQELLMEEQLNSESREKHRSKRYQPVEKDW